VWPGTFLLAEFLRVRSERYNSGVSLELGAATGALAIFLRHHKFDIITWCSFISLQFNKLTNSYCSDIDDGGEVEANVHFNETQNGLFITHVILTLLLRVDFASGLSEGRHIAHTWGEPWTLTEPIQFIIASDILLYVRCNSFRIHCINTIFDSYIFIVPIPV
jgi:hypothetical protein